MNEWLTAEFWHGVVVQAVRWALVSLPSMLLVLALALVALRVLRELLKRARPLMLKRMLGGREDETGEIGKRIDTLLQILGAGLRVVVWTMAAMLLLRKLGIDIAPLIAGAGVAGLAVGFGAQELVRDFIAGFFMLLENQVRTGDVAVVNGTAGLVEQVGLRTIVLRDVSGTVHVFQNGKVNTLANMTKEWSASVLDVGVAYKEDTDRVVGIMREVGEELRRDPEFGPQINEPLEVMGVDAFADSAVVIKARFKTRPIKQWAVAREYRRRLKKAFEAAGVELPFPHRTLYWGRGAGEGRGG